MIGMKLVAAFSISAVAAFVLGYSTDAAAFWKRGAASECGTMGGFNQMNGGMAVNAPSGERVWNALAECAYPDDQNLPHSNVSSLSFRGGGPVNFQACTRSPGGSIIDCAPSKDSSVGAGVSFAVTFASADLAGSWRQANRASDFAYVRVSMREGSGAEFFGWTAE